MAYLKIMLCGASDLGDLPAAFSSTVKEMGFQPVNYFDPKSYNADEYGSPEKNSANAVLDSDIMVYVINKRIGSITWNTEFATAWSNRKPFIVLCHEKTLIHYHELRLETSESIKELSTREAVGILKMLEKTGAVTIPFDNNTFKDILKNEIVKKLYAGIKALSLNNKREALIELLKTGNYKKTADNIFVEGEKLVLLEILNDPFANKEVRKRILNFFKVNKGLGDEQIIYLINDTEQGISRKIIEDLPEIITSENDVGQIFASILETIEEQGDVGIIRRSIKTMLDISPNIATKYLLKLFPANDIGTPKRILSWLNENFSLLKDTLQDRIFLAQLEKLANEAKSFDKEQTLKNLYDSFKKKLDDLSGEQSS